MVVDGALGRGSTAKGGAPSTTDGHFIAFGNTEEHLRAKVLGVHARGSPSEGPLRRDTGLGWVSAK